jgi:hypothetical protein
MPRETPDYPRKIELLEASVAHNSVRSDMEERKRAQLLHENLRLARIVEELTEEKQAHITEKQVWADERALLKEQVDLCKAINKAHQIAEDAHESTAILHAMIFHDRESKRQKTVDLTLH